MKRPQPPRGPDQNRALQRADWWMMVALMVGLMLSPISVMFTSVALPTMRTYFQVEIEPATWIATAYFIPAVALMPLQAQIGERFGQRRAYAAGLLVLAGGSLLAALAPTFAWLLAGRAIQGAGWSALYPLALILIRREYPRARQGEMMGLWESSVGLATILAPLAAGALVQFLGWRVLYLTMGLVAGIGFACTVLFIPPATTVTHTPTFSWADLLGLTVALTLTLLAITQRNVWVLGLAVVAWLGWVWLARRAAAPFVPLALFGNRRFLAASFAAHIRMLAAVAALTALPLFFEDVQGLDPAQVGTLVVIYSIFLFLASWPGGRWSDRAGAAVPGAVGYVAMIAGVLLLLPLGVELSVGLLAVALALRGLGAGLSQAPYAKAAADVVAPELARAASGLYGTLRYSGLALGTALVGIFLQARLAHYGALSGGAAALPAYRQLWLLLAAILALGLLLTLLLGRSALAETSLIQEVSP